MNQLPDRVASDPAVLTERKESTWLARSRGVIRVFAAGALMLTAAYGLKLAIPELDSSLIAAPGWVSQLVHFGGEMLVDLLRDLGLLTGAIALAHVISESVIKFDFSQLVAAKFEEAFAKFNFNYSLARECEDLSIVHLFRDREELLQRERTAGGDLHSLIKKSENLTIVTTWFRHSDWEFKNTLATALKNPRLDRFELMILAPESAFLEERVILAQGATAGEPWTFCRKSLDDCLLFLESMPESVRAKITLYLYDLMPWLDMTIIDKRDAFVTPYPPTDVAQHSPHFQIRLTEHGHPTRAGSHIAEQLERMRELSWVHPRFPGKHSSNDFYPIADYPMDGSLRPKRAGIIRVHPEFPREWTRDVAQAAVSRRTIDGETSSTGPTPIRRLRIVTTWFFDNNEQKENVFRAIADQSFKVTLFMLHPESPILAMRAKQTGESFQGAIENICHTLRRLKERSVLDPTFADRVEVRLYDELPSAPIFEYDNGSSDLVTRLVGQYSMFDSALTSYFVHTRSDGFEAPGRRKYERDSKTDHERARATRVNFVHDKISTEIETLEKITNDSKVDFAHLAFPASGCFPLPKALDDELSSLRAEAVRKSDDRVLHYKLLLMTVKATTACHVQNLPKLDDRHLPSLTQMSAGFPTRHLG